MRSFLFWAATWSFEIFLYKYVKGGLYFNPLDTYTLRLFYYWVWKGDVIISLGY